MIGRVITAVFFFHLFLYVFFFKIDFENVKKPLGRTLQDKQVEDTAPIP